MVARLTPDQKAACSNHVGVNSSFILFLEFYNILTFNMLSPDYSGIWRNVHSTTCDVTNFHVGRFLGYATNTG